MMADSKIEMKVGSIAFSGEGDGDWLSKQLDKVLAKIPELAAVAPADPGNDNAGTNPSAGAASHIRQSGTLAAFLKTANANESQPRKFLATAVWLHDSEQKNRISTTDVTGALSQHNQGKLGNASDCLIKNAGKGFCVREGKQFYVTNEGRESLK
jgi:hypothetical protein